MYKSPYRADDGVMRRGCLAEAATYMKASLSSAHYAALMMPYDLVSYAQVCIGLMMASGGEVVGLKARQ